jgi:enoyl-CoA hydratase
MSELIAVNKADGVATLWLTDPQRRNALSNDMVAAIEAALDDIESDGTTRALVVSGEGRAFCAGADLSQLGASREQGLRTIYRGFTRIADSPLVTIAAVNGPAVGAGMNLALACDIRVAGTSARFDTRFLDLAIGPGGGHTWWMQRLVGPQTAAAMVLCSEVLDAHDAARVGLVWQVVDDAELHQRALELAAGAARAPYELVRRTKATMAATAVTDHPGALEVELVTQVWSMDQPDFSRRLAELSGRISSQPPQH